MYQLHTFLITYIYNQKKWSEEVGGAIKKIFSIENESSNKLQEVQITIFM